MILREIELHTDQTDIKEIVGQSGFHLCDLFLRHLNKFKTPETAKVVIILQKEGIDLFVRKERDKAFVLLNIIELYKDFDFVKYEQAEIYDKKLILWKIIFDSLLTIANQLSWDKEQIIKAHNHGLDLKLENKWIHTDNLSSKDKKYSATVYVHFDFYSFKVFIDIKNMSKETIIHKKIIDRNPNWGWYDFFHYKFSKWTSTNEFSFGINKDHPDNFVIHI